MLSENTLFGGKHKQRALRERFARGFRPKLKYMLRKIDEDLIFKSGFVSVYESDLIHLDFCNVVSA